MPWSFSTLIGMPRPMILSSHPLSWNALNGVSSRTSCSSFAWYPAATREPTTDPADVPATFWGTHPRSSKVENAPARAIPLTPPPSKTRSTFLSCPSASLLAILAPFRVCDSVPALRHATVSVPSNGRCPSPTGARPPVRDRVHQDHGVVTVP